MCPHNRCQENGLCKVETMKRAIRQKKLNFNKGFVRPLKQWRSSSGLLQQGSVMASSPRGSVLA